MGNSSSTSDITSLKAQVKALQTKTSDYATLKTQVADASSNLAKSIDYEALAKKITDVSSYNEKVAAALAKNPGVLGEGLAAKIGTNDAVIQRIWTGLQDNTTFAKTVSDKLTDDASAYRGRLQGNKGDPGELASSQEAVKKALYDKKYTMWCADGDVCKVPDGNTVVDIGSTIRSPGRMHITGQELLYLLNKNGVVIGKEWGGNGNLTVQGELNVGRINIGGWNIREEGDHLVFRRGDADNGDNQPHLRMAGDGNFWVSRSSQRGWVADNLGNKINNGENIHIRSNRHGGMRALVQGSDSQNIGEWEKLRIHRGH